MMSVPTNNSEWGFFGTIRDHADQAEAWNMAMTAIQTATGCPSHAVRDFLDSTSGRHFADDVANGLFAGQTLEVATEAAVSRWMGWKITRRTSRDTGIPSGLPYLTGFVAHFEIMADAD
ncbi:protein of unknown function [Magnetospirillum gryphiswaldense MSR-1 v2]|jgi:hypothetical protein|uniref:Uncharacterized protein n=1 Tax=Magnetospirillum gryphiswaldense (strain DSM 6361 / JCM 21280 / NBRC 15271 / MSR-1) TaxID=431944 RepID=V6EXH5_MAGGM|nr:hypothetical protein [Magnetospirillum gryphiswaldense]CDK97899.1 protein of unknown function [Magnetospirillum gryphiswaldense MSR-1 v2]